MAKCRHYPTFDPKTTNSFWTVVRTNQVSLPSWQTFHIASRAPQQSAHWPCHLIVDHAVPQTAKTISCAILFQPIPVSHFTIMEQPIYLLFNCHLQTLAGLFCHPVNQPPYITCCIQASPFLHRKKCTGGPFQGCTRNSPHHLQTYICPSRWDSDIKAKALHFILWGSRNVYNSWFSVALVIGQPLLCASF